MRCDLKIRPINKNLNRHLQHVLLHLKFFAVCDNFCRLAIAQNAETEPRSLSVFVQPVEGIPVKTLPCSSYRALTEHPKIHESEHHIIYLVLVVFHLNSPRVAIEPILSARGPAALFL